MSNDILRVSGLGKQLVKGSPVYLCWHVHIGIWFSTWHCAPAPHDPGHGSRHLSLMHAWLLGHSELITHSGLQLGGIPMNVGRQEQAGVPPWFWHWELDPHGDGTQGSMGTCWTGVGNGAAKDMKCKNCHPRGNTRRNRTYFKECSDIITSTQLHIIIHGLLPVTELNVS